MPVVGLTFNTLEAKRGEGKVEGKINMTLKPAEFKLVEEMKQEIEALSSRALKVDFEFATEYEPDIAKIVITGTVLFTAADNKKVLKEWKKSKKLPADITREIQNFLFRRCMIRMINMADDLQLPLPLLQRAQAASGAAI